MENARIVHFEDNSSFQGSIQGYLGVFGHNVLHSIGTMKAAREFIDAMEPGTLDVALVDGNLTMTSTGEDGKEIVRRLQEKDPSIITIGFSGGDDVEGANDNVNKSNLGKLPEVLKNL